MILALICKEVEQHGPVFVAALTLVASIVLCLWFTALYEDSVTLLATAHSAAQLVLPALVLFVNGRLVVHDHDQGSHEFLAALPIRPISRTLVQFSIGLALIEATLLAVVLATAAVASRREGVPIGWLVELWAQLALHLAAWHGIAFGVAHLGNARWLAWWTLAMSAVLVGALVEDPASTVYWFGLVSEAPDRTRLAPPWGAVPVTLLWAVAGPVFAVGMATWRGGVLLERAFRPTTADIRARQIGSGVALMLAVSALADQAPQTDAWSSLPAVPSATATVRVAASPGDRLWDVGAGAAAALDGLGSELGIRTWPPVVLLRSRPELGRRTVTAAPAAEGDRSRVLLVDPDAPVDELVRRVVTETLIHRLAGLARWDSDAQWVADGAASWWLATDRELLARRAALGAGTGAVLMDDWYVVVARLGPDVASGVAWAGLVAIEEELGRDAVLALLGEVLTPDRSTRWLDGLRLRWQTRGDWSGLEPDRRLAAWEASLTAVAPPTLPPMPKLSLTVEEGAVLARWDAAPPPGATLEIAVVDPLQRGWLPGDATEVIRLPDDAREVQLRVDLRSRIQAQFVRHEPSVGQVTTGWGAAR